MSVQRVKVPLYCFRCDVPLEDEAGVGDTAEQPRNSGHHRNVIGSYSPSSGPASPLSSTSPHRDHDAPYTLPPAASAGCLSNTSFASSAGGTRDSNGGEPIRNKTHQTQQAELRSATKESMPLFGCTSNRGSTRLERGGSSVVVTEAARKCEVCQFLFCVQCVRKCRLTAEYGTNVPVDVCMRCVEASGAVWEGDENKERCTACDKRFGWTRRRHHCRRCGRIFCWQCSSSRRTVPRLLALQAGDTTDVTKKSVRVCGACHLMPDMTFWAGFMEAAEKIRRKEERRRRRQQRRRRQDGGNGDEERSSTHWSTVVNAGSWMLGGIFNFASGHNGQGVINDSGDDDSDDDSGSSVDHLTDGGVPRSVRAVTGTTAPWLFYHSRTSTLRSAHDTPNPPTGTTTNNGDLQDERHLYGAGIYYLNPNMSNLSALTSVPSVAEVPDEPWGSEPSDTQPTAINHSAEDGADHTDDNSTTGGGGGGGGGVIVKGPPTAESPTAPTSAAIAALEGGEASAGGKHHLVQQYVRHGSF